MDPVRFDRLAKSLTSPETRRRVFGVLAAMPAVGGLLGILAPEETEAAGRRKRRKKAHKHGKGRRRKHKKKPTCTPTTCAEQGKTCGRLSDGCGKTLDCGPCTCATGCPGCQACNPVTDQCDPVTDGTTCDDDDRCTVNDVCTRGVCGGSPKCGGGQGCVEGVCCLLPTATGATQGLQEAIDGAASGDTIRLCAGTWNLTSTVSIAKNLTVIGAAAGQTVLDGGNAVVVLQIEAVTVTLQDLTVRNGYGDAGGGIYNGGALTLSRVDVTGNRATYGAGIYSFRGSLTVETGSRVTGNTALNQGGGIAGPATLRTGSVVTGNAAANGGGGFYADSGFVTVDPGAVICSNTPLNDQCSGAFIGTCPAPGETCPS